MSNELQQFQQKIWVKEQEINALKVQNRHLIAKLEEAEQNAKPNQINTQAIAEQISNQVQAQLKPALNEIQKQNSTSQTQIEKSLTHAFELMQATLRGVYQQSQRSQQAVDSLSEHSRDLEIRTSEARKNDQTFYQEKIFSLLVTFFERVERQLDTRLSALSSVEHMITKQNETLKDIESIKAIILTIQKSSEVSRSEVIRIEKGLTESSQKLLEIEVQGRNAEEITRDALQQIQHHRTEFKLARGEIRNVSENIQKLNERVVQVDEHMVQSVQNIQDQGREHDRIRHELKEIEESDSIANLIEAKSEDIEAIQNVIDSGFDSADEEETHSETAYSAPPSTDSETREANAPKAPAKEDKEDLVMILELLKAQKSDLKKVAKDAETYLKEYRSASTGSNESNSASGRKNNSGNRNKNADIAD